MAGMVRKPAGCFARVRRAQAALRQMSDRKSERRLLACESTPGVPGDEVDVGIRLPYSRRGFRRMSRARKAARPSSVRSRSATVEEKSAP